MVYHDSFQGQHGNENILMLPKFQNHFHQNWKNLTLYTSSTLWLSTYVWQIRDTEAWKQRKTTGFGCENVLQDPSAKSKGKLSFLVSLQPSILLTWKIFQLQKTFVLYLIKQYNTSSTMLLLPVDLHTNHRNTKIHREKLLHSRQRFLYPCRIQNSNYRRNFLNFHSLNRHKQCYQKRRTDR